MLERGVPPMTLAEGVKKYLEVAGGYGRAVELARFGLSKDETVKLFSAWDEDYQINRYMLLTLAASEEPAQPREGEVYVINGFECSHVCFQSGIEQLL
jgi:hypothetical protein